jgi:hypothetical protein
MNAKIGWALAAGLGLVLMGVAVHSADRETVAGGGPEQPGRYSAVASSPEGVLILDTATGQVYRVAPDNILPWRGEAPAPAKRPRAGAGGDEVGLSPDGTRLVLPPRKGEVPPPPSPPPSTPTPTKKD